MEVLVIFSFLSQTHPKTDRANLFLFFEKKFLFWGKCLKSPPKSGFLTFAKN